MRLCWWTWGCGGGVYACVGVDVGQVARRTVLIEELKGLDQPPLGWEKID